MNPHAATGPRRGQRQALPAWCSRWRRMRVLRPTASWLLANTELLDPSSLDAFLAAHPCAFLATALSHTGPMPGAAKRLPATTTVDDVERQYGGGKVQALSVSLHAMEPGVCVGDSTVMGSAAAAAAHAQLVHMVCVSAGVPLTLSFRSETNTAALRTLLAWEADPALTFEITELELMGTALLSLSTRANRGQPLRLLRSVTGLIIRKSHSTPNNSALTGVESLTELRTLVVESLMPLQSLQPLASLPYLRNLFIPGTAIGDADIRVLGSHHMCLEEVCLDECLHITSLAPLAALRSLRVLYARGCKRLSRVADIAKAPSLRVLNLSFNAMVKGEELGRLLSRLHEVQQLTLADMYLCSQPPDSLCLSRQPTPWLAQGLCHVNLVGAHIRSGAAWLARMPHLQQLRLTRSDVTEADLVAIFHYAGVPGVDPNAVPQSQVEILSLEGCRQLYTSLAFALPLRYLKILSIGSESLTNENYVAELRARGVDL